jgi:hypothetical protein
MSSRTHGAKHGFRLAALCCVLTGIACSTWRVTVPEPKACDANPLNGSMEELVLEISAPDAEMATAFVRDQLHSSDEPLVFVDDLGAADLEFSLRSEIPDCVRLADNAARFGILAEARARVEKEGLGRACQLPVLGCPSGTHLAALTSQGSFRLASTFGSLDARHRFVVLQYDCSEASAVRRWLTSRVAPRGLAWGTSRLPAKAPDRTFFSCPQTSGQTTQVSTDAPFRRTEIAVAAPPASCWIRIEGAARPTQVNPFMSALEGLGAKPVGPCVTQDGGFLCPLLCEAESRDELELLGVLIKREMSEQGAEPLGIDPSGHVLSVRLR